MPIFYEERVRMTRKELARIRKAAAQNGHGVQDINTLEDLYEAAMKMLDAKTLSQVNQIYAEVAEEFNLTWPPETSGD